MSRVQLALNVGNLEEAIAFYSKIFGTEPAKIRDGYANFAIAEPPLKLVLIQGGGTPGSLNHLGVEVESTDLVEQATQRFASLGLPIEVQEQTSCCYAVQDKVWVQGADTAWEFYTVLADAPDMACIPHGCSTDDAPAAADSSSTASGSASKLIPVAAGTASCC
jgi:catechol 2,3-dioxygenase-like lactoylglutathione lyase family enzyme